MSQIEVPLYQRREDQSGIIGDPIDYDVLDPAAVKHQAVESANEAATMIGRIDDVIRRADRSHRSAGYRRYRLSDLQFFSLNPLD